MKTATINTKKKCLGNFLSFLLTFSLWFAISICYGNEAGKGGFQFSRAFKETAKPGIYEAQPGNSRFGAKVTFPKEYAPGWYICKVPYRCDADWGAQFVSFVEYAGKEHPNPSNRQSVTVSKKWSEFFVMVKLEHKGIPALVFLRQETPGVKFNILQIKKPEMVPFNPAKSQNWFPNKGRFKGEDGGFPMGWTRYKEMMEKGNGLTGNFRFKGATQVLEMTGSEDGPSNIQSMVFPFPGKGELEFSVWARGVKENTVFTIYLLGDAYKWHSSKRGEVGKKWTEFKVRAKVPAQIEKSPFFWCRIQAGARKQIFIGKVQLNLFPEK